MKLSVSAIIYPRWTATTHEPHFAFLSGKRPEAVQAILSQCFAEATWREPSVIILDDLDQIASAPTGPEQEMSGEALYFNKIAQSKSHDAV